VNSVGAVGDQGGRADATSDADPVEGDEFVADEPDQTGCSHPADMLNRDGVDQTSD
jgi:hypothetical protein